MQGPPQSTPFQNGNNQNQGEVRIFFIAYRLNHMSFLLGHVDFGTPLPNFKYYTPGKDDEFETDFSVINRTIKL